VLLAVGPTGRIDFAFENYDKNINDPERWSKQVDPTESVNLESYCMGINHQQIGVAGVLHKLDSK